ncbi:MAG TPA: hypothetical protein VGT00_17180 [Methylomirabilota bacterium]|jgi:hypothetical protein|nr:hypothetical protein [Methylomirabilota bacterium]
MTNTLTCRLDVLEGRQTVRYRELRTAMKGAGETRELPDGYAVRFPSDPALFVKVAEWITLERRCCSFLDFGLAWSERDGVLLRLTGGPGVKTFLGAQLSQKA